MTLIEQFLEDGVLDFGQWLKHDNHLSVMAEVNELINAGLAVIVSTIPHHFDTLNSNYIIVANDAVGRKLALDRPLFTATVR
jgi:hypothetical protein